MGNCDGLLAEQILYNSVVKINKPSFYGWHFFGITYKLHNPIFSYKTDYTKLPYFSVIFCIVMRYELPSIETVSFSLIEFSSIICAILTNSGIVQSVVPCSLFHRDWRVIPIISANSTLEIFNVSLNSVVVISSPLFTLFILVLLKIKVKTFLRFCLTLCA